jgi:hypothetical protein
MAWLAGRSRSTGLVGVLFRLVDAWRRYVPVSREAIRLNVEPIMWRSTILGAVLATSVVSAATAQMPPDSVAGDHPHTYPFTNGSPDGWTFGPPHLDVAAGYYDASGSGGSSNAAFFRAHAQLAIKSRYLQLSSDIQFVPALTKANPSASLVLQIAPLLEGSHFYFSAGAGLITNHTSSGAAAGWVQTQFAWRAPIHGFAFFGQLGRSLNTGSATELLIGVQHPLAPYRAHGLKS